MARSLFVVVTDDATLTQRARNFGLENNVTVQVYSSQAWSEGLEDPGFRGSVQTEPVALSGGGDAKVYNFPTQNRGNGGAHV